MKVTITPRITLVIIAALFVLPLVLAWLMYIGAVELQPESTRNKGILVSPPTPFDWSQALPVEDGVHSEDPLEGLLKHWVVLYPLEGACNLDCEQHLSSIRQVHLASGRDRERIRLVILFPDQAPANAANTVNTIYDKFIMAADTTGELRRAIESASSSVSRVGSTYLIDPLGNIMMVYPATSDPNDLKEDLKRLLKWSKLDEQS
jgi:hypothetical protein